jgi:hypothetical protein
MSSYQYPMERVLYNLHHKLCTLSLQKTTARSRRLSERLLLFLFVAGFGVTMLVHVSFVHKEDGGRPSIPLRCLGSIPGFSPHADVTHLHLLHTRDTNATTMSMSSGTFPATTLSSSCGAALWDQSDESRHSNETIDGLVQQPLCSWSGASTTFFSYSPVQGYLFLSPEKCAEHNIVVQHVVIATTDEACFGEPFLQKLVFYVVGPDTVMVNWLMGTFNATGYIYNPRSKTLVDLNMYSQLQNYKGTPNNNTDHDWLLPIQWYHHLVSKAAVVLKTSFLFFIVTTLVSFILRETQERMLEFTHQLQRRVRNSRPVVHLVTTHVVENLVFVPIMVGMIFFLIELYRGDKVAAFMVLSIVWVCEAFSVVRCVLGLCSHCRRISNFLSAYPTRHAACVHRKECTFFQEYSSWNSRSFITIFSCFHLGSPILP